MSKGTKRNKYFVSNSFMALPCRRKRQRLQHRPLGQLFSCPSTAGNQFWSAVVEQPAAAEVECQQLKEKKSVDVKERNFPLNMWNYVKTKIIFKKQFTFCKVYETYYKVCITIVFGQAPASCDTLHATWVVVTGLSQTHRGHMGVELGRRGQFDHSNVIVDG